MKKTYIEPSTKVIRMQAQPILAGSTPDLNGGDYEDGNPVLAPELYYDEDF